MDALAWYPMPPLASLGMAWVGVAGTLALLVGAVIRRADQEQTHPVWCAAAAPATGPCNHHPEVELEPPAATRPSELETDFEPASWQDLREVLMSAVLSACDRDPELADRVWPEFLVSEPNPNAPLNDFEVWYSLTQEDARRVRASLGL